LLLIKMAGYPMPRLDLRKLRVNFITGIKHSGATSTEVAALWWVGRAGYISLQDDTLTFRLYLRVWDRHGRQESLGIGV
jgi:hypothetical protein